MTQIRLDAHVANQLHGLGQVVELCDPTGRVLGRFVPALEPSEWEAVTPEVSEEELERRGQGAEWYTTEEVLARLKDLENR